MLMGTRRILMIFWAACLLGSGCRGPEVRTEGSLSGAGSSVAPSECLARVDGEALTQGDVDALRRNAAVPDSVPLSRLVDAWVQTQLLAAEGRRQGLDRDPEVRRLLAAAREQALAGLVAQRLGREVTVTDADLRAYYERNKANFQGTRPGTVDFEWLAVPTEDLAISIKDDLAEGKDFGTLARQYEAVGRMAAGLPVWRIEGKTPDEVTELADARLAEGIFNCRVGWLNGPLKYKEGYLLYRVTRRSEGQPMTFEDLKETLRTVVENQKRRAAAETRLAELRKAAHVYKAPEVIRDEKAQAARQQAATQPAKKTELPPRGR